jgi:hypothetical protein
VKQSCCPVASTDCSMTDLQPYWTGQFIPFNGRDLEEESNATAKLHQLCRMCEPIRQWLKKNPFDKIANRGWLIGIFDKMKKRTKSFPHYATGHLFEKSVQNGCHLCALLWHSAISHDEDDVLERVEIFRTLNGFKANISATSPGNMALDIYHESNENTMSCSLKLGPALGMQPFYLPLHSLRECPKGLNCFSRCNEFRYRTCRSHLHSLCSGKMLD